MAPLRKLALLGSFLGAALTRDAAAMSTTPAPPQPGPPLLFNHQAPPPPIIRGVLPKDVIQRVIFFHMSEIRGCYQRELGMRPSLAGRVQLRFRITDRGQVEELTLTQTDLGLPSLKLCITEAVQRWEFPRAYGDQGATMVTYPLVLRPRPPRPEEVAVGVARVSDEELERLGVHKEQQAPTADILF